MRVFYLFICFMIVVFLDLTEAGRQLDPEETDIFNRAVEAVKTGDASRQAGLQYDAASSQSNFSKQLGVKTALHLAAAKLYKEAIGAYQEAIIGYESISYFDTSSQLYDRLESTCILAANAYQAGAKPAKAGVIYKMLSAFYRSTAQEDKAVAAITKAAKAFKAGGDYVRAGFAYMAADKFAAAWNMYLKHSKSDEVLI